VGHAKCGGEEAIGFHLALANEDHIVVVGTVLFVCSKACIQDILNLLDVILV
jgi:hypothetical protein